jgi:hypothetical protein
MITIFNTQKQNHWVQTLTTLQQSIRGAAVVTGTAWTNTVNDVANVEMACLRKGTACVAGTYNLALHDSANNVIFDSHAAVNGFTLDGAKCATFAAAGNVSCPISYTMTWSPYCPVAPASCINPQIFVKATLLLPQVSTSLDPPLNPTNYSVNVLRGGSNRYDVIIVENYLNSATPEGPCATATWTYRKLNATIVDSGNNVLSLAANSVTLRAGTYQCHATAPAYQTNGAKIALFNASTNTLLTSSTGLPAVGPGVSAPTSAAVTVLATVDSEFTLNANAAVAVGQACTTHTSNNDLGVPVPDPGGGYTDNIYTVLQCARIM